MKKNIRRETILVKDFKSMKFSSSKFPSLTIFIILFISIIFSVSYVSAYRWVCLTYGESLPDAENPVWTCWHDSCQLCVTNSNYPTSFNRCNDAGNCESLGNSPVDNEAPALVINSPVDGEIYDNRLVLFDIESNEPASFYYLDNINGRGEWQRLAGNVRDYFRELNFRDGFNSLAIKAIDRNDNEIEEIVSFFVDSKNPKIRKVSPRGGFTNGMFEVEFSEENPVSLELHYGLAGDSTTSSTSDVIIRIYEVNLDNCTNIRNKYVCDFSVDLREFDGREIEYWLEIRDIAGNEHESRHVELMVDTSPPIILNPDSFWSQNEENIYFDIFIDEDNFDRITYTYELNGRTRERALCSRLKDSRCIKRVEFRNGEFVVDVMISDLAGNAISERIEFEV